MKILLIIILLSILQMSIISCSSESSSVSLQINDDIFLIKDQGYKISDFKKFLEVHGITELSQIGNKDKLLSSMLDSYIEYKLIENEIKKEKLEMNNNEVKSFIADLDNKGVIDESHKGILAKDMLIQKYLMLKLVSKLYVTDQEVADYYNQNKDKFYMRERIMISQILVEDEQVAEDLYTKLVKKPSLLKDIISKKGLEDIKVKGVVVATYQKGELPQEIEDYLWRLPVGEINKPYMSESGDIMLFMIMNKKTEELAPLEEVKHIIIKKLSLIKMEIIGQKLIDKLAKDANIKIYQKNLDFIYSGKYMNLLI